MELFNNVNKYLGCGDEVKMPAAKDRDREAC